MSGEPVPRQGRHFPSPWVLRALPKEAPAAGSRGKAQKTGAESGAIDGVRGGGGFHAALRSGLEEPGGSEEGAGPRCPRGGRGFPPRGAKKRDFPFMHGEDSLDFWRRWFLGLGFAAWD